MPDVIFLSSLFNEVKIAEPMGCCILTACLREKGFTAEIMEPSLEGWSVEQAVDEVATRQSPIVALSMLRDRHVEQVLTFVRLLRARCPERFICIGGHGPSIAVDAIDPEHVPVVRDFTNLPNLPFELQEAEKSHRRPPVIFAEIVNGPVVDPDFVDRGKGAGHLLLDDGEETKKSDEDEDRGSGESPYFLSASDEADSPYFDKSREYLSILKHIDTYMLGEADTNFPMLVERVLQRKPWRDIPGLAFFNEDGRLIRNPGPPKIENLGTIPHMARDVLVQYQKKYGSTIPASILASRGCYYRCTFCSVVRYEQLQLGSRHRQRPNEDIIAEIRNLHESYGVTHFNFEDDNFIVKNKRGIAKLHDLCDRLISLDFPISFAFFCRADAVSEELFRHFRDAGLVGIYFGMESVHATDLEFFHKGTKVEDNFRALDILLSLGFSLQVGSEMRIMLGYITWHPLTTFDSLHATSRFIQRYQAPPKLLRRKLRLYSATEVVEQVAALGLINPQHKDGWNFKDPRIETLDRWINMYAATVNKVRDQLRTIEKANVQYRYPISSMQNIQIHRQHLDHMLYRYFDEIIEIADVEPLGASSPAVAAFDEQKREDFQRFMAEYQIKDLIEASYQVYGFNKEAVDLFRK